MRPALLHLVFLAVTATIAIRKAENADWKWANAGIIVGTIVLSLFGTAVIGFILGDADILPVLGPPVVGILGLIAAVVAISGNKWRAAGIRKGRRAQNEKSDTTVV